MRKQKVTKKVDAEQLRQELSILGSGVAVEEDKEKGEVRVVVDDTKVDGVQVDLALRRHFPKSLLDALGKGATPARLEAVENAVRALVQVIAGG